MSCPRILRRLIPIEENASNDEGGAKRELHGELEAEDEDGEEAGEDDGQGTRETLQNVVGVLHHDGHQHATC